MDDHSIFKNLITYLDDLIIIQEGYQSLNINTIFLLLKVIKIGFLKLKLNFITSKITRVTSDYQPVNW
jgi:hypothetical protein